MSTLKLSVVLIAIGESPVERSSQSGRWTGSRINGLASKLCRCDEWKYFITGVQLNGIVPAWITYPFWISNIELGLLECRRIREANAVQTQNVPILQ